MRRPPVTRTGKWSSNPVICHLAEIQCCLYWQCPSVIRTEIAIQACDLTSRRSSALTPLSVCDAMRMSVNKQG
ncbi:hypothetical protein BaRGS_00017445, partial [Batillaria attramentaria]